MSDDVVVQIQKQGVTHLVKVPKEMITENLDVSIIDLAYQILMPTS